MKMPHHHSPFARPIILAPMLCAPVIGWSGVEIDQTPLTVGKPLEPNIMFIMDDSGSMAWEVMPGASNNLDAIPYKSKLTDDIRRRAANLNALWYNPLIEYKPWLKHDGSAYPDSDPFAAPRDPSGSVQTGTQNLAGSDWKTSYGYQRFYVLDEGKAPDKAENYKRYEFRQVKGAWEARVYTLDSSGSITKTLEPTEFVWPGLDSRSIEAEVKNFANWFSYYRTRANVAKASASHVFAELGEGFRVGYDTIHNRETLRIPVSNGNGLFSGENKQAWFERLFKTTASSGTPLREALGRAGEYFTEIGASGPYGPEEGSNQLTCRQNFSILTTDGYWNGNAASNSDARKDNDSKDGDSDGKKITGPEGAEFEYKAVSPYKDGRPDTLADVAMYYWKNDLRPSLENNVPTVGENKAFWQHMRTFGVSIGEKGVLDPTTDLDALKSGAKAWPEPGNDRQANIDDLWHAALNSQGQFIVASDPQAFSKALKDSLDKIAAEKGRSASGAASSTNVSTGSMTFFSEYVAGQWTGDVLGYALDPETGTRATDPKDDWSASSSLPAWSERNILMNVGGTLTALTWGNLDATQQTALSSEQILDYLRGDRSNEKSIANPNAALRERAGLLGSFVNSQPVYVGAPPFKKYYGATKTPGASNYAAHVEAQKDRAPVLYVGGNDGMLHGFLTKTVKHPESKDDIAAGTELFAFMPSAVMTESLRKYATDHDYQHRYFVDGEITVAEVFVSGAWKTVLVGTLGRGGKSVFALDVTDPFNVNLLWEKTVSDIPALGNTLGKPIIAEVGSGFDDDPGQSDWRVLLGNGPNSSGDRAQLISISLVDGSVKTYDTGVGGDNGLSAVLVWDADKNGFFETVYAGDLRGNLWRFSDLGTAAPPAPFKLFGTAGNRPITAAPWAAVNQRDGRTWIFVGTGQYLNEDDRASLVTESWYGLIDDRSALNAGTTIGSRETSLVKRNIVATGTLSGRGARTLDNGNESEVSAEGKRGWYIDFNQPGERMITPNSFYGNALIGTTFIPDGTDLCKPGGRSALWGINPFTGGRLSKALFDFNHDGTFDDKLDGLFPSVMDNLKPILVGVPPITIKEDGDRRIVVMHTDPDNSEEFRPPSGDAQAQSWREVLGE